MKRTKIFVTLSTSLLCLALLITGIYAAIKAGFGVNTTMSFITDGVFLEVSGGIYRGEDENSLEILDGDESYKLYKAQNFVTADGTPTGSQNIDSWQPNDVYFTPNERTIQFRVTFRNCGTTRMTVCPGYITGLPTGVTAADDASTILSIGAKEEATYKLTLTLSASHSTDIAHAKFDVEFTAIDADARAATQTSWFTGSGTELQGLTSAFYNDSANKSVLYIPSTYTSTIENPNVFDSSPVSYIFKDSTFIRYIILPEGFTELKMGTFMNMSWLESVYLPESLTFLGAFSFSGCESLKSITLGENITTVYREAFYNCTNLEYANMPESITRFDMFCFGGCTQLRSIYFSKNANDMDWSAFSGCTQITFNVNEGNSNYSSLNGSLYNKDKTKCIHYFVKKAVIDDIPETCTSIGFDSAKITKIILPKSITSVGFGSDCTALQEIYLEGPAFAIEYNTFGYESTGSTAPYTNSGFKIYVKSEYYSTYVYTVEDDADIDEQGDRLLENWYFYQDKIVTY